MSKKITRTIVNHVITLGVVVGKEVKDYKTVQRTSRIGKRELDKLSKEAKAPVIVISDTLVEELRGMTLETFIEHSETMEIKETEAE